MNMTMPTVEYVETEIERVERWRAEALIRAGYEARAAMELAGTTNAEWVDVRGTSGLWLSGAPHVFFFPREPARLAGSTLIWEADSTTYRLEGPALAKADALALARSLRDTP